MESNNCLPGGSRRIDHEGVVPVAPRDQQTGVGRCRALEKRDPQVSDYQFSVPDAHHLLGDVVQDGGHVCEYELRCALRANEVTVRTGRAQSRPVQVHVHPEERVRDFDQRRGGYDSFQGGTDSHPEGGENGALAPGGVGLSEQLQRHLSVGLYHGPHGCLLRGVRY